MDKRKAANLVSPYFREYDAPPGAESSPLLSSRTPSRYHVAQQGRGLAGGHRKTSILPQLFSSSNEGSPRRARSSPRQPERQVLLPFHHHHHQSNRSRISVSTPLTMPTPHQESMHVIPKNSILTRLEHLSSLQILCVLLVPLLFAAMAHFSLQPWKYTEWSLACEQPCLSSPEMFQLENIPAWSSFLRAEFIAANSSQILESPVSIAVNLSSKIFLDSYKLRLPATKWVSLLRDEQDTLRLALPLLDLSLVEFSDPGSTLATTYAVEYGDAADDGAFSLYVQALSWHYVVCTSAIKILLLIALAITARRLYTSVHDHARYLRERVELELYPFPSSLFSKRYFVLPEQYACLAGLASILLWLNPVSLLTDLSDLAWIPWYVRFGGHALSACGAYGVLGALLWYLKCLRWSHNATDEKMTLASLMDMENSLRTSLSPSSMLEMLSRRDSSRLASLLHSLFCTYATPLHPKASEFVDHMFSIGALFLVSCLIACVRLWVLLCWRDTTTVHSVNEWVWANADTLLCLLDVLLVAVAGLWCLFLVQNYWRTQKALRNTRYMQSRLRQVSFRIFAYQVGMRREN